MSSGVAPGEVDAGQDLQGDAVPRADDFTPGPPEKIFWSSPPDTGR